MPSSLTQKQTSFCSAYVECGNASEAYRRAYPRANNWKPETVHKRASELLSHGAVLGRIEELKDELAKLNLWTREQSVKSLISVIERPEKCSDIIAAVRELNAMHGFNAPDKLELSGPNGTPLPTRIEIDWGDG